MALSDLLKAGAPEGEEADVPDDASELADDDGVPADPPPSRRSRQGRRKSASRSSKKASKPEQDQVRDALTLLYTMPAWGLKVRDPHCGGILLDQRDEIVKALTPIVCRNPAMLAFFTAANAPWMDYLALFQALLPVGQAIWGHHITRTAGDDAGGGAPVDLSVYGAPVFG